jgi:hypothetical protein
MCRSRSIVRVFEEDAAVPEMVPVNKSPALAKSPIWSSTGKGFEGYLGDPEVLAKIKELQIARLEKQIAEEEASVKELKAFNRLVGNYKYLLSYLVKKNVLSKDEYRMLADECPWCNKMAMEFDATSGKWVCKKCGEVAE